MSCILLGWKLIRPPLYSTNVPALCLDGNHMEGENAIIQASLSGEVEVMMHQRQDIR